MAKINVFYIFSVILSLVFISYLWLVFLPLYENSEMYVGVRNVIIFLSLVLITVAIINLLMARAPSKSDRVSS